MATPVYPPTITTNILVNTRINPKIVYLPAASTIGPGRFLFIKDICGNAANSSIFVSTTGLDTLENKVRASTLYALMNINFQSILLGSDGSLNWMFLQNYNTNSISRASTGFNPTEITGLQLWLDSADTSSFVFSSGSNISQWKDKSGNLNNATATGSPILTANSINGYQSVANTSGKYFTGAMSITGTTLTAFAVATTTAGLPLGGSDQRLISVVNTTNVDYGRTDGAIPLFNQSGTATIAAYRVTGPLANNAIVTNTPFMAASQFTGTNSLLWFNGSPGTVPSVGSSGTFAVTKYGIGNLANPTAEYWRGFIGEIIIYNSAITTVERQQIEGYLAWKWGLQGNLPANHPYKNGPP